VLPKFIDPERLIHSFKTAIACMAAFLLAQIVGFNGSQWLVITTIVVMCAQIYVGSVLNKAYLRFFGTLMGCLFAILMLKTFGDSYLATGITIGLSSLFFSYIATGQENLSYAGTLGAVTTAIIMLGQKPTITFATERFLEISVGILIATLVSQFILPIHARTHLRRTQADTLSQLRDYFAACMISHDAETDPMQYEDLDESIIKSLTKQRQLSKEAVRERLGTTSYDPEKFVESLRYEREILRAIDFMHIAYVNAKAPFTKTNGLTAFNDAIVLSFNALIRAIEADDNAKQPAIHIPLLNPETTAIEGLAFSAENLSKNIVRLAELYRLSISVDSPN
jgi:uncharacterized membrane protein YgaE (UPF0421/DUF939 family)